MNEHVSADLSAYLDEELAPTDQARVSAHLEGCGRCAAQLADLRATATLMAALPSARPSRSLVPSLAPKWNWLRPMRSFSAVTSGAFLMVFLVASVAQSGSNLGGGPLSPFGGAGAQAGPAAAQPAAPTTAADAAAPGAATAELKVATESPAFAAAPAAPTAAPEAAQLERAAEGTPSTAFSTNRGASEDAEARSAAEAQRSNLGLNAPAPSPLIWLGLSLLAAALAFAAHWRLRAA